MMPPTRAAARTTTVGRASSKIAIHGARLREIEPGVGLADDVGVSRALQCAVDRRTRQPAVAGDVDECRGGRTAGLNSFIRADSPCG